MDHPGNPDTRFERLHRVSILTPSIGQIGFEGTAAKPGVHGNFTKRGVYDVIRVPSKEMAYSTDHL